MRQKEKTLKRNIDNALKSFDFDNVEYYTDKLNRLNYLKKVNQKQQGKEANA